MQESQNKMGRLRLQHLWFLFLILPAVNAQLGNYIVVAPRNIRSNSSYSVGITCEAEFPVTVVVSVISGQFYGSPLSTQRTVIHPRSASTQLLTLQVGDLVDGSYKLSITGTGGLNFAQTVKLTYSSKSSSILIQTDKPIYKPGELARFRVLYLDRTLRPKGAGPLDITVKDSQGHVIKIWKSVWVQNGVFSGKLQLSSQPNLGDWTIEVATKNQKESQQFTIAEYVLPKFNVDIDLPNYATFNNSKITARVRATYTYGKAVKGELDISAYPTTPSTFRRPASPGIVQKIVGIDGSAEVEFDLTSELQVTEDSRMERSIQINAIVTEPLTGRQQNASKTLTIYKYDYKLEIIKRSESIKPGLPYTATIKVSTQDNVPVSDPRPDALQVRHRFFHGHKNFLSSYAIPPTGLVELTFDTPKQGSLRSLDIIATYKQLTEIRVHLAEKALSRNNVYLKVAIKTKNPKVKKEIEVEVASTAKFSTIYYDMIGRGDLLLSEKFNLKAPSNRTYFRVLLPANSAPKATLVVYIIHNEETPGGNEIIADSVRFNVAGDLDNYLNIAMTQSQTEPGEEVEIAFESRPNSLIGLRGIDQSVLILKEDRDIDLKTVQKDLDEWNAGFSSGGSTASELFEKSGLVILTNALVYEIPPYDLHEYDYRECCDNAYFIGPPTRKETEGTRVETDKRIMPPAPPPAIKTRKHFPETWLWETFTVRNDGRSLLKKTVPDTITSWVISGFSLDSVYGLGVSEVPMKLKVFRPFFVSLNVPYSVVKGEAVGVQVLIHNYMDRDIIADLTLNNTANQFTFTQDENEVEPKIELYRTEKVSVKANSVSSVTFLITPTKIGLIDLNVKAQSRVAGDAIVKMLKVVPPGQTQKYNKAALLDLRSGKPYKVSLTAHFPPKRVPESDFVKVSVVADVLGPAITNLDTLLELPTGCGEQNMAKFVPDIVILEYLQATDQLTEAIRHKAINFLEIGYQRELSYRHDDGSFSAFGQGSGSSGSTWLTAYVIRSFIAAKPHIFIDNSIIEKALEWLISKQESNGRFTEVGRLYDVHFAGQSTEGIALTAYVALALVEANFNQHSNFNPKFASGMTKALDYLTRSVPGLKDPYAVTLITYVFTMSEHHAQQGAFNVLQKLAKLSEDGHSKYWETVKTAEEEKNPWSKNTRPIGVEATSYALLTYTSMKYFGDSIPVLRWLLDQRNSEGGFISTQDTVVGLTALSRFARLIQTSKINLTVKVSYEGGSKSFHINNDNSIALQEIELPGNTRWVNIEANGTGVAIVQLSWGYNVEVTGAWPSFTLDPQVDRNSTSNQMKLSVCTSYFGGNQSNMAVMEVNMPTGYSVDKDRLPDLLHHSIKRYETDETDSKVVMYFEAMEKGEENCPTVSAYRAFPVAKQAPAYVTVYDYYDNSRKARQFYDAPKVTVCDICDEKSCSEKCFAVAGEEKGNIDARVNDGIVSASAIASVLNTFLASLVTILMVMEQ